LFRARSLETFLILSPQKLSHLFTGKYLGACSKKEASQVVTKSAFFQARKQLSYKAFIELNRQIIDTTYKSYDHLKTWRGFRLCAVDGSSIRLPNTPD
jgi:hypothetical protein